VVHLHLAARHDLLHGDEAAGARVNQREGISKKRGGTQGGREGEGTYEAGLIMGCSFPVSL
jgi:tRNA U34 5-methylaminomethyl-2-thiouridine-forming methyltransferase MnmC